MNQHSAFKAWMEQRGPTPVEVEKLARECRRSERNRKLMLWCEIAFGIACLSGSGYLALVRNEPVVRVWTIAIWISTIIAWGGSTWSRRMESKAATAPAADFLTTYASRVRAGLWAIRFGFGLLYAEIVFIVLLFAWSVRQDGAHIAADPFGYLWRWGLVGAASGGAFVWLHRLKDRKAQELERVQQLQSDYQQRL